MNNGLSSGHNLNYDILRDYVIKIKVKRLSWKFEKKSEAQT